MLLRPVYQSGQPLTTRKFNYKLFLEFTCSLLTPEIAARIVHLWDTDKDGSLNFREIVTGLTCACRCSLDSRLRFCFTLFATDPLNTTGTLNLVEIRQMVSALHDLYNASAADKVHAQREISRLGAKLTRERTQSIGSADSDGIEGSSRSPTPDELPDGTNPFSDHVSTEAEPLLHRLGKVAPAAETEGLGVVDFMTWMQKEKCGQHLNDLLGKIGHLVFGIKPIKGRLEGEIIALRRRLDAIKDRARANAGLSRESHLVSSVWWQEWTSYTTGTPLPKSVRKKSKDSRPSSAHRKNGGQSPKAPGEIRNQPLARTSGALGNWNIFSSGGGWTNRLRKNLTKDKDYILVSDGVWALLHHWYGGGPTYSRPVVTNDKTKVPEVELYPLVLKVMKYIPAPSKNAGETSKPDAPPKPVAFLDYECSRFQTVEEVLRSIATNKRVRKKMDSVRLWDYRNPKAPAQMDDKDITLATMGIDDGDQIVLEIRNADLSWPSELLAVANAKKGKAAVETRIGSVVALRQPGATGLSNLGNTCYMNAALQCLSNTHILTEYFQRKCHLTEINKDNPIGTKGAVAKRYANLIRDLWRGSVSVAPAKLLDTIAHHAPQFRGNIQHDSQELLAFLIDGLHEDLNRVMNKPYVERKDSDGRPDCVVAKESWQGHLARNASIVVDLFHGLIKSQLRCKTCQHTNVTFDPFSTLTLPLPSENTSVMDVMFRPLLDSVPTRLSVEVDRDATFLDAKAALSLLVGLPIDRIVFIENLGTKSQNLVDEAAKLSNPRGRAHSLSAYEIASPLPKDDEVGSSKGLAADADAGPGDSTKEEGGAVSAADTSGESVDSLAPKKSSDSGSMNKPFRANGFVDEPPTDQLQSHHSLKTLIPGYIVVVHRRQDPQVHFLTNTTSIQVFGDALLLETNAALTSSELYAFIWARVKRFVNADVAAPFTLKLVDNTGTRCSRCHWNRFCSGCTLAKEDVALPGDIASIAIEWNAEDLHLSFDYVEQRRMIEHESVQEFKEKAKQPILLIDCLRAFTKEENMGPDESWYCPKCKTHREATKKLDIWTLPPVLIIHLKRFHMVNGRWVKSQRHVDVPHSAFDIFQHLTPPAFEAACAGRADPAAGTQDSGSTQDSVDAHVDGAQPTNAGAQTDAGAHAPPAIPTPESAATNADATAAAESARQRAAGPDPAQMPGHVAADALADSNAEASQYIELEATESLNRAAMGLEHTEAGADVAIPSSAADAAKKTNIDWANLDPHAVRCECDCD